MGLQDGAEAAKGLGDAAQNEARRNEKNAQIESERKAGNAQLGSTLGSIAGGAMAGSAGGPWGMAIGALIGGIAGGLFSVAWAVVLVATLAFPAPTEARLSAERELFTHSVRTQTV
jgi:predicted lipid-binding transport protein (Tim44 family)